MRPRGLGVECSDSVRIPMKKYHVLKHPDGRLEAVKEGFSFPGFLFSGFWFLWHKMWLLGGITIVIGFAAYIAFPSPEGYILNIPYGHKFGIADISNIGIEFVVGFLGNEWRLDSLKQRGYARVSTENADTTDGAKAKYLLRDTEPIKILHPPLDI